MAQDMVTPPAGGSVQTGELQRISDAQDFLALLQGEEDLSGYCFEHIALSFEQPTLLAPEREGAFGLCLRGCRFHCCQLVNCVLEKLSFIDTSFENCDCSNSRFNGGFWQRCQIQGGKWLGADFSGGAFRQVTLEECNYRYANFDGCKLDDVTITACDAAGANFSRCKLKQLSLQQVQLQGASFFYTPLKGVDLTQCQIEQLVFSQERFELAGAIVNLMQGAELARLLGVVIR